MTIARQLLSEAGERALPPGTVLRFAAAFPYEPVVDFMIFQQPGGGCGLVVTTGLKSGFVAVILPDEAQVAGVIAISGAWLAANWTVWVWPDGTASAVRVIDGYPAPDEP